MFFFEVEPTGDEAGDLILNEYVKENLQHRIACEAVVLVCWGAREHGETLAREYARSSGNRVPAAYAGPGPASEAVRRLVYPLYTLFVGEKRYRWDKLGAQGMLVGEDEGLVDLCPVARQLVSLADRGADVQLSEMRVMLRDARLAAEASSPSPFQAALADALKKAQIAVELEEWLYGYRDSLTRTLAIQRGYWDDLKQCTPIQHFARYREFVETNQVFTSCRERLEFLSAGRSAASRVQQQVAAAQWPQLFIWFTVYFLRLSQNYLRGRDSAAALAALARAMETYFQALLIEDGRADFGESGQFLVEGAPIEGLAALWRAVCKELGTSLVQDFDGDTRAVIRLRNKCALAHGVQRPAQKIVGESIGLIERLVSTIENKAPDRKALFSGLWRSSDPAGLVQVGMQAVGRAWESTIVHI